ncbi:hypothetical protein P0082_05595 [Candidatus Haliotispira prima]|uniref:Glycosyltransferase RgtA/B/C/D-like domain-containing protein n=1 Tax=Candidatus Haliotispira prima TaxID=3034016 RepID=A0ABY8MJX4_9SPIO|nr:hypothetical protein P0082_05595 [Candidatus Haliotispira prima]
MLKKVGLTLIIAALAFSQYRIVQWKQQNQILEGGEVRSWQIALDHYGLSENYRSNHTYDAQEVLRENRLAKGYHLRAFVTQLLQKIHINIDPAHPNLYYALLRFTMWKGVDDATQFINRAMLLNLLLYIVLLVYLYRFSMLLFDRSFFQAILVLVAYTLMMGHLNNLMLIRMYYLAAMSLLILCYYIVRAITEQSFTAAPKIICESRPKSLLTRFFHSSTIKKKMTRLETISQSPDYPHSLITYLLFRLRAFSTSLSLRPYYCKFYLVILLTLYLNYCSHYFSILAVFLWGLILIFHYRRDRKALFTFVEILIVSIFLMAVTQQYFLYNLATASHTDTILGSDGGNITEFVTRFLANIRDGFFTYQSMFHRYFIPQPLFIALLLVCLASIFHLFRLRKGKRTKLSVSQIQMSKVYVYLIIVTLSLPLMALLLSPVGKVWRIIAPYTPLFALLIPLLLRPIRYTWLRCVLFAAIVACLGWTYPERYRELQSSLSFPEEQQPKDIKLIYVVSRVRGDTYYHHHIYFYRSTVRLLSNHYLQPGIQYRFFDTVEDINPKDLRPDAYILLGPYMGKELEYLKEVKGLTIEQEYIGNLYSYQVPE